MSNISKFFELRRKNVGEREKKMIEIKTNGGRIDMIKSYNSTMIQVKIRVTDRFTSNLKAKEKSFFLNI